MILTLTLKHNVKSHSFTGIAQQAKLSIENFLSLVKAEKSRTKLQSIFKSMTQNR